MDKIKFVLIGNLSFDYNRFPDRNGQEYEEVMNFGGATLYSGVPASLFDRVGIVAKVGEDYDFSIFDDLNIETKYIKTVEGETTRFYQTFTSEDGQLRDFSEKVNPNTVVSINDIPSEYLNADYIHVCTNYPKAQYEIIKYLKENSKAILSIDTLEDYYYDEHLFPYIKASFDLADIAYIDKEFNKLFSCNAKTKIIKLGSKGCMFISQDKKFTTPVEVCNNVVDKTGAGDCVTGVFNVLKANGYSDEDALQTACNVATESIKDYGMLHLNQKKNSFQKKRIKKSD